jgi:hypothetical protein
VAGELQLQIDIDKAVSRLLFFSSFDDTMTEQGLDAEGLTEMYCICTWDFVFVFVFVFVFSPLMRQQQNYFSGTNTRTVG